VVIIERRRYGSLDPDREDKASFKGLPRRSRRRRRIIQMVFSLIFLAGLIAFQAVVPDQLRAQAPPARQSTAPVERRQTARFVVTLPADDAELVVDGKVIGGIAASRSFETAPLDAGTHSSVFTVTWRPNTYTTMTRTKTVAFRTGGTVNVDLTADDPADRVRVIYVPTPDDVAKAMVDLAGVRPEDVIYEPGCGDARITTAAIRAGASRGICIDIDPERAKESKANVEAAGFANRIDVREGDALDVKNLSDVSVVFLYMGEHFNMLVRPVLWRELKLGSRIVSHRFTMGDWKPDKTISVVSENGGFFELHLWTITEDIKRQLASR
jgi:uncharacterized protein (TIGR03000 family)